MTHPLPLSSRPYVLLPSGGVIDLAEPDPDSWSDEDLAVGLARTYRWGGHSRWPRPLSVAQHSLLVLAVAEQAGPLAPTLALYELLHDAEEGLIGFDCIAPLKVILGEPFARLCARLAVAVGEHYQLPTLSEDEYAAHKYADRLAAASEALHVAQWTRTEIATDLQIVLSPLGQDPLEEHAAGMGYLPWEPWTADHAAREWLSKLRALHSTLPGSS